jgi:hypothetical protein
MNTIKEFLQATKENILKYGWCQDTYFVDKQGQPYCLGTGEENLGGCCLSGAMVLVEHQSDNISLASQARMLILNTVCNRYDVKYIPQYNDAPGRTQEEIIALLDKLIEGQK